MPYLPYLCAVVGFRGSNCDRNRACYLTEGLKRYLPVTHAASFYAISTPAWPPMYHLRNWTHNTFGVT
jgi:hypothetical protein